MAVVNINGSVWSSIHYDHSCCDGDQEGFLIGEVVFRETTNISDSQMSRKTEEVDINITSHCPCREPFSFYDSKGHIDKVKILALLKSNYKNVIGFYRFRRNTQLQPSLREISLFKRLVASLSTSSRPETFLLGLFSSSSTWNLATHLYPYQLFTLGYNGFTARKVSVVNLGDTAESEYKLSPVQAAMAAGSMGFQQILGNYSTQLIGQDATVSGVQTIQSLSTDVHNKLQEVKQKVSETEGRVHQLAQEVCELRRRAKRQRQEKASKQRVQEQALNTNNTNNNAGLAKMETATSHQAEVPMSTEPIASATISPISSTNAQQQITLDQNTDMLPKPNALPSRVANVRERASSDPKEAKSSDPFAGLLKDMKQSLSKGRSSSFNSPSKDNSPEEDQTQKGMNGTDSRTAESRRGDQSHLGDSGSAPSSQEGLHRNPVESSDVDDDETQIDDSQYCGKATLSPTF